MTVDIKFRAVVQLHNGQANANDLKRLALFFDEIYFAMPTLFTVKSEFLERQGQARVLNNGISLDLDDFVFSRDVEAGTLRSNMDLQPQLAETLSIFQDHGIAKEVIDELELPVDDQFLAIRDHWSSFDVGDKTFNELCETVPEEFTLAKLTLHPIIIYPLDKSESPFLLDIIVRNVPNSILASYETTTILYASHATSAFPVFLHPLLKKIMEYRYVQYKKGLKVFKKFSQDVISPVDFKASFGEITFNITNSLILSELIAKKTPEQIIKYRNAMTEARQHFLSENLLEIASMVQDNPWNARTKEEIEKYIIGKLNQAILQYDEASCETWEKLFGNIAVHISQVAKSSVIGSGAGGLVGNLIPNTSTWHMLLLGALAGATTEAPNLVKSIVETILESRKTRRSSIAYIARFK